MLGKLCVRLRTLTAAACVIGVAGSVSARTLQFGGHMWNVRANGVGGPRNNTWCEDNAFVDASGYLHLKLTNKNGVWCAAEIVSVDSMGFGTYQWQTNSRVDTLDQNVVFGLFNYPPASVGPDETNEIDIEFTKWGNPAANGLNFTVYPATKAVTYTTQSFPISLGGDYSTHRFTWSARSVHFQSTNGHYDANPLPIADWTYAPSEAKTRVGATPLPVHINLWITGAPTNGQPVEMVISSFRFTPA